MAFYHFLCPFIIWTWWMSKMRRSLIVVWKMIWKMWCTRFANVLSMCIDVADDEVYQLNKPYIAHWSFYKSQRLFHQLCNFWRRLSYARYVRTKWIRSFLQWNYMWKANCRSFEATGDYFQFNWCSLSIPSAEICHFLLSMMEALICFGKASKLERGAYLFFSMWGQLLIPMYGKSSAEKRAQIWEIKTEKMTDLRDSNVAAYYDK